MVNFKARDLILVILTKIHLLIEEYSQHLLSMVPNASQMEKTPLPFLGTTLYTCMLICYYLLFENRFSSKSEDLQICCRVSAFHFRGICASFFCTLCVLIAAQIPEKAGLNIYMLQVKKNDEHTHATLLRVFERAWHHPHQASPVPTLLNLTDQTECMLST